MPSLALTLRSVLVLGVGLSAAVPTGKPNNGPICSDVVLPVTVSAENRAAPDYLTSGLMSATATAAGLETLLNSVGNELQTALVNGTWNIAARYCEPETHVAGREKAIQLLVHGIGYDRNYWSGYDREAYSWIAHASKLGYPTLSIDRLGSGASDHPDPITVVQKPAQVEVAHQVVQALRNGDVAGRVFSNIAYVGHSYGSLIGNGLAARYPNDVDAFILSGFSDHLKPAIPGFVVTPLGKPAALVDQRFSNLSLGYMAMSVETGARGLFYTNTESEWDVGFAHSAWLKRGTYSVGEAISTLFVNDVAEHVTKPVLTLTGHKDQIFCGLALPLSGEASCGSGPSSLLEQTKRLFPNADYTVKDIPNTGHSLNFHHTANLTFAAAHDFLHDAGF